MELETTLSQTIRTAGSNSDYDSACKRLLSEKIILAWIMKNCLEEYRECSISEIIEKYIGRKGKKLFFLFCWIFTLIVIAAFADMVAGTFNGISADGAKLAPNASAASISILYVFVAMAFGLFLKKVKLEGLPKVILGIALILIGFFKDKFKQENFDL